MVKLTKAQPRPMTGLQLSADQQRKASAYKGSISHGAPAVSSETIPEWAMKMAREYLDSYLYGKMSPDEAIALALLAAEQRGRKAGIEEAYSAVRASRDMDGSTSDDWDQGHACAYGDALFAIRSLGEKT